MSPDLSEYIERRLHKAAVEGLFKTLPWLNNAVLHGRFSDEDRAKINDARLAIESLAHFYQRAIETAYRPAED